MSDEIEAVDTTDARQDVSVFGVSIGTADGWDNYNDTGMQFNEFEPNEQFKSFFYGDVEPDTLCIDPFGEGMAMLVGYLDETEVPYDWKKFVELLVANAPR
jgi:hypothetical protein